jgi:hypothetical protein
MCEENPMSDEKKKPEDKTKDDKSPEIKDLEPEKDPSGGDSPHDTPPGHNKKDY